MWSQRWWRCGHHSLWSIYSTRIEVQSRASDQWKWKLKGILRWVINRRLNRLEPTGEAHLSFGGSKDESINGVHIHRPSRPLEIIVIGKSATGFVPTCPPITRVDIGRLESPNNKSRISFKSAADLHVPWWMAASCRNLLFQPRTRPCDG